ncbi:folylpolyglutamate synthase/dihydrofolate synthase family protein [Desulforamulus ruminis]|uniref:bifunctional folylpolyglutamate synthase/dihydrofolate synthase n=1 Tax=Desulforamulus ruminis TaxID=1564 RepID=UPI002FD9BBEC
MNYQQAMDYLKELTKFGINLGLDRIEELLRRLDRPQHLLKIIHIGGTNGKGSTSAMVAGILGAAGYRTGLFTSPHLHSYTERFVLGGEPIEEETLARLISEIKPHLDDMVSEGWEHPTEFEVSTALALLYFARERTDFVVLEVGMGGAIDSTNVVMPMVSVITNVTLDHMDYLGQRVEEIAQVKAGIIKPGIPVVTAAQGSPLEVIRRAAETSNSRLVQVGRDVSWFPSDHSGNFRTQQFEVMGLFNRYPVELPLLGPFQQINAATAVAAVELLFSRLDQPIPFDAVIRGLLRVHWPGRFEVMGGEPTLVIDGAHNHAGAMALKQALQTFFPHRKIIFVLGMLADKERAKVVAELVPLARAVVVTRSNSPRAGDWTQLADYVRKELDQVTLVEDVGSAIKTALAMASPGEVVCVTGSLYMIAEAGAWLKLKGKRMTK